MDKCRWCDQIHDAKCPLVKAIEYHEDGVTVKRVEFITAADVPQINLPYTAPAGTPAPQPLYPWPWYTTTGGQGAAAPNAADAGFFSQH